MQLFARDRVVRSGLSLVELLILGLLAGAAWAGGTALANLVYSRSIWFHLTSWDYLRFGLGIVVGTPLFGWLSGRIFHVALLPQIFAVVFAISGGGVLIVIGMELLVRRVLGS